MDRRALTLLELLIALAVLVGITSLVLPSVLGRLVRAQGEEARGLIDASVTVARARATSEGRPVRVGALTPRDDTGVVQIMHTIGEDVRVYASLPAGCRVMPVAQVAAFLEPGEAGEAPLALAPEERAEAALLCVLLPDGTAAAGEELALVTGGGRAFAMEVAQLSGGVSFEVWSAEEAEGEADLVPLGPPGAGRLP